jgi:hypothetical protein
MNFLLILFSPMRVPCPAHPNILDLIILITFGEQYKYRTICDERESYGRK